MPKTTTKLTCPEHPWVELVCPGCIGSMGGSVSTPAKAEAARRNARRGTRRKRKPTAKAVAVHIHTHAVAADS